MRRLFRVIVRSGVCRPVTSYDAKMQVYTRTPEMCKRDVAVGVFDVRKQEECAVLSITVSITGTCEIAFREQ